jgi:hypothetical protein
MVYKVWIIEWEQEVGIAFILYKLFLTARFIVLIKKLLSLEINLDTPFN